MTQTTRNAQKFNLGRVVMTRGIDEHTQDLRALDAMFKALARHARGDWGLVDAEDRETNDRALAVGDRLVSAYEFPDGRRFWIITEADRSATTVLFPEEY